MARTKTLIIALFVLLSLPVLGQRVQIVSATSATNVASLSATITLTAGNMLVVQEYNGNLTNASIQLTISDTKGDVFQNVGGSGNVQVFTSPNVAGGSTTVTVAAGVSTTFDLVLTEVSGMAKYSNVTVMGGGWQQSSTTEGTFNSVTLPAGTYYLYSSAGDLTSGSTYTATAGFTAGTATGQYIHKIFDQTVTIGSPTSYSITVTSSASINGAAISTWCPFLIFSSVPLPATTPRVVQYMVGGSFLGIGTTLAYLPVPVTVGNYLLAYGNWFGAGAGTISDSQGNVWTLLGGGTSADSVGLWVTKTTASNLDTVTLTGGSSPAISVYEIGASSGLDVSNVAGLANFIGTTITSTATTTVANDLVLELGGTQSACNTMGFTQTADTGFAWSSFAPSHCANHGEYTGIGASVTAYSTTIANGSSGAMSAAVAAFKPGVAPIYGTQPVINVVE
jgi:hypothetical protein